MTTNGAPPAPATGAEPIDPRVASMAAQLGSLYEEREQLQRHLGLVDAADVVALVESLRARAVEDSAVAGAIARDRALLERCFGTADVAAVCAKHQALAEQLDVALAFVEVLLARRRAS